MLSDEGFLDTPLTNGIPESAATLAAQRLPTPLINLTAAPSCNYEDNIVDALLTSLMAVDDDPEMLQAIRYAPLLAL
jgi:hypothetical protein